MAKCAAFTLKGHPCKGLVRAGSDYCPAHDPARADSRRRAASKAARSKLGGEVRGLKDRLEGLIDDVLAGRMETKVATVVIQGVGAHCRILEFERKVKETEEFEARLEALEEEQEVQRKWESQST
jgi:hypothetical protein